MKILIQIGILCGLFWVSQCVEAILPVPFPASVISLLLLLVLLVLRVVREEQIREKADFLLNNLGFFFVPVSVSIMNYAGVIRENAAAFLTICVVSTVLTFAVTAAVVHLACRLTGKREGERE